MFCQAFVTRSVNSVDNLVCQKMCSVADAFCQPGLSLTDDWISVFYWHIIRESCPPLIFKNTSDIVNKVNWVLRDLGVSLLSTFHLSECK